MVRLAIFIFLLSFFNGYGSDGIIRIDQADYDAWLPRQDISGRVNAAVPRQLLVHLNGRVWPVRVNRDGLFSFPVDLLPGRNKLWISGGGLKSRLLTIRMLYVPAPLVKPFIQVKDDKAILGAAGMVQVNDGALRCSWTPDRNNPAEVRRVGVKGETEEWEIPEKEGRYFFHLSIHPINPDSSHEAGYSVEYTTYIVRRGHELIPYDMQKDHAPWIKEAVLYEITPDKFVPRGGYADIVKKLPELKQLGVNTLWLQPVFKTNYGNQGYDVIDYFSLRQDLGPEQQLRQLILSAKAFGMRVILDFVPNHTSLEHPYAQDCRKNGAASHYCKFYQRGNDGAAYSSFYHTNKDGFYYYFWEDLVNLDYSNAEVQQWVTQACIHWLRELDIDGFRMDALWGIRARAPQFLTQLATVLKSIKPDLLLLAEDKKSAMSPGSVFFDAGYDWTADTSWISQWSWNTDISRKHYTTFFNLPDVQKRAGLLRQALFGDSLQQVMTLHFIENNDLPRFLSRHTVQEEKTAAALVFLLPGLPLIYNGQEAGCLAHPYSTKPIFRRDSSIRSTDSNHLFEFYELLTRVRSANPCLQDGSMRPLFLKDSSVVAFVRERGDAACVVLVNPGEKEVVVELPLEAFGKIKGGAVTGVGVRDLLTKEIYKNDMGDPAYIRVTMKGPSTRCLVME